MAHKTRQGERQTGDGGDYSSKLIQSLVRDLFDFCCETLAFQNCALLTIRGIRRRTNCEGPNFSGDDRCNAPIIRKKSSALLPLRISLISYLANPNSGRPSSGGASRVIKFLPRLGKLGGPLLSAAGRVRAPL